MRLLEACSSAGAIILPREGVSKMNNQIPKRRIPHGFVMLALAFCVPKREKKSPGNKLFRTGNLTISAGYSNTPKSVTKALNVLIRIHVNV